MDPFVHLHLHTEYSLLDGACRIKELIARVKELGQPAVAITDHGVMYGVIDFYKEAKKQGVKPIIGCEVYVAPRTRFDKVHGRDNSPAHLVLLCKNETGYQNLIHLVSRGFTEGFYSKPRIDHELLAEHTEGLVCLSACLAGEIPRALMAGDYEKAKKTALFYRDTFGPENYYIEIQNHGIPEQIRILPDLARLAKEIGVGLVATNDSHYLNKEDSKTQHLLICIQTNHTIDEEADLEFPTNEFYVKTGQEMGELFAQFEGALENTVKIAEMCDLEFEFGKTKLPLYVAPNGRENTEYFRELCVSGLHRYYGENPDPEISARLEYELETIIKMGYVDYYLIVFDFIHYAKSKGIPVGPGRGSGAGSLAAYCIGITGIDPIRYNLLFERFLNPERISMPDFDIDFCYERRQEVIDYVVEKYGSDHVAQIITFGTMAARGGIRDVGRAMGLSYQEVDQVAKLIPMELHMTIEKAMKVSAELRSMCEADPRIDELVRTTQKIEGMARHSSTHAAGVVITRDPVDTYVPVQKTDEAVVTQFTMTTLEELGLLKMDFLGLRNLTVIADAERMIRRQQPEFSVETIPLDDKAVFDMLSLGLADGVFQFESAGMRQTLAQLKPTAVEDLIAINSLYRPGPMDSIPKYIENRHHPERVTYKHPLLQPILEVTYGCIVYQEQVMQICRQLAGYSYGQADLVRRAMSKKKADVMEKEREGFLAGAQAKGVSRQIANEIFDEMSSFASYAFNKSHAAAYATVAYQTAYLKCHYPKEYMAALLTSVLDNTDKVIAYINECDRMNIKILPPDINLSDMGFTVEGKAIRFGLLAVKNLGRGFIKGVVAEREAGAYESFSDLCRRLRSLELNRRTLESLIKCGSLDSLGETRKAMLTGYQAILEDIDRVERQNLSGQVSLFESVGEPVAEYRLPKVSEFSLGDLLTMEKDVTGLYISSHPMMDYEHLYANWGAVKLSMLNTSDTTVQDGESVLVLGIVASKKLKATRKNDMMAFIRVEDVSGSMEMLVFPKILEQCNTALTEGRVVAIAAKMSVREDEDPKLICERAMDIQQVSSPEQLRRQEPRQGAGGYTYPKETLAQPQPPKAEPGRKATPPGLYLRMPSEQAPAMERVRCLLEIFGGDRPVYIRYVDTGRMVRASANLWCDPNPFLLEELEQLVGQENVRLVE